MKNLFTNKKFLVGLGIFVIVIIIFLSTGILKFEASFKKNSELSSPTKSSEDSTAPSENQPEEPVQQMKLASRATEFSNKEGTVTFSIKLPLGWSTVEDSRANLIAGSLTPEKLANGQDFTVNLNAIIGPHESLSTFADYQSSWKDQTLAQYPSMEFISDGSEKINEMDVYILEVKNSRPDGIVLHQIQYVFYADENFALVITATAPEDSWKKYQGVIKESFASVGKLTPE